MNNLINDLNHQRSLISSLQRDVASLGSLPKSSASQTDDVRIAAIDATLNSLSSMLGSHAAAMNSRIDQLEYHANAQFTKVEANQSSFWSRTESRLDELSSAVQSQKDTSDNLVKSLNELFDAVKATDASTSQLAASVEAQKAADEERLVASVQSHGAAVEERMTALEERLESLESA